MIADIFKIIYGLTGSKLFSLLFAVTYITILNLVVLKGLGLLIQDWLKVVKLMQKIFAFPYLVITFVVMFGINFLSMLPLKNLRKERQKKPVILPIAIYTLIAILIFLYIRYIPRLS